MDESDDSLLVTRRLPLVSLFQLSRQFPNRQIPPIRLDFIRHRPLQNDLSPGVIGDFHQAGGQRKLVAERDERFQLRSLDPGL